MKLLDLIYVHKGYGRFPYIIQRIRGGLYKQIPIQRETERSKNSEGLFLSETAIDAAENFDEACKNRFRKFWIEESAKGEHPIRACLVFNPEQAYYLDEKCEGVFGPIPSGGWLLSMDGDSIISTEGEAHYIGKK